MQWGKLVVVPNTGLYGSFGRVPCSPRGFYKWAFNFGNYTLAWVRDIG